MVFLADVVLFDKTHSSGIYLSRPRLHFIIFIYPYLQNLLKMQSERSTKTPLGRALLGRAPEVGSSRESENSGTRRSPPRRPSCPGPSPEGPPTAGIGPRRREVRARGRGAWGWGARRPEGRVGAGGGGGASRVATEKGAHVPSPLSAALRPRCSVRGPVPRRLVLQFPSRGPDRLQPRTLHPLQARPERCPVSCQVSLPPASRRGRRRWGGWGGGAEGCVQLRAAARSARSSRAETGAPGVRGGAAAANPHP